MANAKKNMVSKSNHKKVAVLNKVFDKVATSITRAAGRPAATIIAMCIIIIWAVTGPVFHYSDTWQLVINTGTTIITFIMVFIIQQSQNKDTMAVQLKLNELIASASRTSNRLINIEDLTDDELQVIKKFYVKLAELAAKEKDIHESHSIDRAKNNHALKMKLSSER